MSFDLDWQEDINKCWRDTKRGVHSQALAKWCRGHRASDTGAKVSIAASIHLREYGQICDWPWPMVYARANSFAVAQLSAEKS